jgi:hypothetical protein
MAARDRKGSQTMAAASCRARKGIRNCCTASVGLVDHRELPTQRYPIRSSVRIAMFDARWIYVSSGQDECVV